MRSKLVLFDIDGTLIDARGAGRRALESAFAEILGLADALRDVSLAGATDHAVLDEVLGDGAAATSDETRESIRLCYLVHLETELARRPPRLLPGVRDLLDTLARGPHRVGLATGNFLEGALRKLRAVELWDAFSFGGFGDGAENRTSMLRAALERGRSQAGEHCDAIVIGDTLWDIRSAQELRVPCLAVATGPHSATQLREAGADFVVEDLCDPLAREVLQRTGGGPDQRP